MALTFTNVTHLDGEELLIDFSDGTSATFSAEELAQIRPNRSKWNCEADEEISAS